MPYAFNPFTGKLDFTQDPGGTPGGTSGQAQFNNAGAFGGAAGLTIDPTTGRLTLASFLAAASAPATPASAGFALFAAPTTGALSWKGANGFVSTLNATDNTGDRSHQLQDRSGTLAHLDDVFDGYAVGNYITPVNCRIGNGANASANIIFLTPFTVLRSIRVNELVARVVTTQPSSAFQLAVYDSQSGLPAARLASTADMSGATAAAISSSVSEFSLLAGRLYWFAVNTNATLAFVTVTTPDLYFNSIVGVESIASLLSSSSVSTWNRTFNHAYGTWPDLTGQVTTLNNLIRCPVVGLKISAFI